MLLSSDSPCVSSGSQHAVPQVNTVQIAKEAFSLPEVTSMSSAYCLVRLLTYSFQSGLCGPPNCYKKKKKPLPVFIVKTEVVGFCFLFFLLQQFGEMGWGELQKGLPALQTFWKAIATLQVNCKDHFLPGKRRFFYET